MRQMARRPFAWLIGALVLIVGSLVGIAAIPDPAQFELDGNARRDGVVADDWANALFGTSSALTSTFIVDGSGNKTIFTTGGSKDVNDISQWQWKDQLGGLPDKDNITNAYAAAYTNAANDLIIYFGADRYTTEGDAQLGFWFFRNQVQAVGDKFVGADGTTTTTHSNGDILVLANMSNGGTVFTAQVFQWLNGGLSLITTEADAKCGTNTDPRVCFTTNALREAVVPWSYQAKGEGANLGFPERVFFEGGINITQLLGGSGGAALGCFSSFLAETRSSTSQTATLKDFALGEFNTCNVDIVKSCPTVTYNPTTNLLTYNFDVTVTNSGFGALHDLVVTDVPQGQTPIVFNLASLGVNQSHTFQGSFTQTPSTSMPNPPTNVATVEAAVAPGGQKIVTETSATVNCPAVSFDAALSITKSCTTAVEALNGVVVVVVNVTGQVCNNPPPANPLVIPESITGINVTDVPAFSQTPVVIGTLTPGQCQNYTAKYYPSTVTGSGAPHTQTYSDTVTAAGTGAITGSARVNTASANCPLCPPN